MKNNILALFFSLLTTGISNAQYYNKSNYGTNKSVTVYTAKYTEHIVQFEKLLSVNKFNLLEKTSNLFQTHFVFTCDANNNQLIDSQILSIGYITESSLNKNNTEERVKSLEGQIDNYKVSIENDEFAMAQNNADTTRSRQNISNANMRLENNIRRYQQKIKDLEKQLEEIEKVKSLMVVNLYVKDEISTPNGNDQNITWVNMPGVSYSFLQLENPKLGLTHEAYAGFNLKYLFTRGKSYVELGVLKPVNPYTEEQLKDSMLSATKNDFFTVQFGQDFYTRHFGRGRRKFLNLYSGYTVGAIIPNRYDDAVQKASLVSSLSIGVELFKSKHVLIDTRAAYFLPINNENRNTRGIMYNAAFNFVF